ncbi:hypothetical protein JK151_08835 [Ralstonia syzygii subsp. celebesensis]|nr:hypothetical protein [Ralstonia syzygii]QQV54326.1 hypothetical protein JK151_08835 [Ralstonia syzygii subsp. celebesensis]
MKKLLILALFALSTICSAQTKAPIQLLNPAGSTSGQAIISTGPSTAPAWGNISTGSLSPIAANSVLGNATGSNAAPAAVAVPSCSTSASALNWTSASGFSCNTAVNAGTLGNATFAAPGAIGSTTPGSGAFTTLSATSTVSGAGFTSLLSPYAPLASPTFTGAPGAPTAATGTSTTQLATTAFVANTLASPPAIGNTTANTGRFTTLTTTGAATPASLSTSSATITGGSVDGTPVGATTASTGRFTTVTASGNITTTGSGTLPVYNTAGTGSGGPHMVTGNVALSSGSATVTFSGSAAFGSLASYVCTATDNTAANAVKVSNGSGTSMTITGTGTDSVLFMCVGN